MANKMLVFVQSITVSRIDRLLLRFLVFGFLASMVYVALDPFGYAVWILFPVNSMGNVPVFTIHKLTVLGCFWIACFLDVKLVQVSLLKRLGLILVFGWIGYQSYDMVFYLDYQLVMWSRFTLVPFQEGIYRLILEYLVPVLLVKTFVKSLRIQLRMILVLFLLNLVIIGWLESTGFYQLHINWRWGFGVGTDPVSGVIGWTWFIGKLGSFLAFPLAFVDLHQRKAHADSRKASIS